MKFSRWYRLRRAIPIVTLWLAFSLRLHQIDRQSVWWDEGHSIFVALQPLATIPTLPAMDVHPPAYFALLHLWQAIAGISEFSLRYLSTIFGVLIVAMLWRFGGDLSGSRRATALLAALFGALSPMYVAYSQEVRSYTMVTFLALTSTYLLWRITIKGSVSKTNIAAYIFLTTASLYTHYFTIFLLLFQNAVWLAWIASRRSAVPTLSFPPVSRAKRTTIWLVSQGFILVLFMPQLALAFRQISSYANPNLVPPALSKFIRDSWQAYTVGLTIDPGPAKWGMWLIAGILVVSWALVLAFNKPRRFSTSGIPSFLFLVSWLLIPLGSYFIVLQSRPSFEPRYLMLATPPIFLLLATGLAYLRVTANEQVLSWTGYFLRSIFALFVGASVVVLFSGLWHYNYNETYFKDDTAGVARWLASQTTSNDIVYVDVPHPFHYYVAQLNIPAPTRYLFVDIHTAADILNQEAAGRDRLYWVTWQGSDTDPRGVIPFLAEKAGVLTGQHNFSGYQVSWFDLPANAVFSLPTILEPANAIFGDVLRLDGIAYSKTVTPGEPVWATLHFTLLRDTNIDYKLSLRLRSDNGQVVTQDDRDLLNDRHFRTATWPLSDPALNQSTNVYLLQLSEDLPSGTYQLEAVLYNAMPPYPSEGVSGQAVPDGTAALVGSVTVR